MDWDDLRYFLALARRGAIRAAGADLGVSHTTVGRRVEALEDRLGTRLFDRHRDGFVLTEDGRRMLAAGERVEAEMALVTLALSGRDERLAGTVRVTCADTFMGRWILDALRPWCAENPGVELAIGTEARMFDLAKGEADLALRVLASGTAPPEHLVGTRVAPLKLANYAARAVATSPGAATRWLGYPDLRVVRPLLAAGSYPDLPIWGSFSSLDLVVHAARAGVGLALLPTYVGDADPQLCRMPLPDVREVADIWLLHHPDLRGNARVKGARSALRMAFERDGWLFSGAGRPEPADERPEPR